ncbi:Protein of unknown function [Mesorhizobium albiziae]|uniref:DUF2726 domain-containing protein n=1 Tax=Neomesorhizobium albiziae TaxID=335020 RepID=A0A1I4ENT3_9HYPH|nr:DUF2726 domain-containing protein [Mesorhizobium albiziae]SFL07405.1 Protein of unknown function [Mesorhizobium albiziae]
MLHELFDLAAEFEPLIVVLIIGAVIGATIERYRTHLRRQAWKRRNRGEWKQPRLQTNSRSAALPGNVTSIVPKPIDAADQLRIVMGANFAIQPLLNRGEARLFRELDRIVMACNPQWQVMAQVALGEILSSPDTEAYRCINSKRVDLLLVDENCRPRHVVEYQGGGHYQGTAAARDAVKKEALRRAGIGYCEVVAGQTTPSELKRLIEKLVEKPASSFTPVDQDRSDPAATIAGDRSLTLSGSQA